MTKKPPKSGLEEPEAQYKSETDDTVEFTDAYWDAWFERNAEALNASLREAREQLARGEGYTIEETMARVKAVIERVAKKD